MTCEFEYHSNKLNLKINMPELKSGIAQYLNQFGQLYYGSMSEDLYYQQFCRRRQDILNSVTNIDIKESRQTISFNMHMCRVALTQPWIKPALISQIPSGFHWGSGSSRVFSSGLCKNNPHQQIKVLMLLYKNSDPTMYINNPVTIDNEQKFYEVLGLDYLIEQRSAELSLSVKLTGYNQIPHLLLEIINDQNPDYFAEAGDQYLTNYLMWRNQYGNRPQLDIYTDWPELISDRFCLWNSKVIGSSTLLQQSITLPGHLEYRIYQNRDNINHTHVLYVVKPRPIDLGDFHMWMDLEHNVYVDHNMEFLLYRKESMFKSTSIGISQIPTKYSYA